METIGILFMFIGAIVGFFAKRIVMGRWNPKINEEKDIEEFEMLVEKAVLLVKFIGLALVVLGFIFIFFFSS